MPSRRARYSDKLDFGGGSRRISSGANRSGDIMAEHPRARLARLFDLRIAYDPRGLNRVQFLAPGMEPKIEGPWRIYGFRGSANEPPETSGVK